MVKEFKNNNRIERQLQSDLVNTLGGISLIHSEPITPDRLQILNRLERTTLTLLLLNSMISRDEYRQSIISQ